MNDRRLDLSVLDPMRDPERWRSVMNATLARVDAVIANRVHRTGPLTMLAAWYRPVLAAAALTLLMLIPIEYALERRDDRAEYVGRLVSLSTESLRGQVKVTADILIRAMHGGHTP
jgi:hypothetical protein